MTKKQKKLNDARINHAYCTACSGIEISIMDTPRVWKVGEQAIADGADDATLGARLRAFVETIRHN